MSAVKSFKPVSHPTARILILGSMPGLKSLTAAEYYAHPRNSFWRIMGSIVGFEPSTSYEARLTALKQSGIALWDVLHSCNRTGSLDSAIEGGTRVANDLNTFLQTHANIEIICFNGMEAEKSFNKYVLPSLNNSNIRYMRLPSTSPAHAGLTFDDKLLAWSAAINPLRLT